MLRIAGTVLLLGLMGALLVAGCGEDTEKPEEEFAPPTALRIVGAGTDAIAISWGRSSDEGLGNFEGYIIYWNANSSLASLQPPNFPATAKSDTVLKGEPKSYTVQDLDQGTKYFIHVRAYKSNGDYSRGTNEIDAAPRPEGTGTIYEKAAPTGNNSGFDFSAGQSFSFVIENRDNIDIYLGTVNTNDSGGDLYLKSPDQVQSANDWSSRASFIKDEGTADTRAEYDEVTTTTDSGWLKKAAVLLNHVYVIKTPENNYAKIWITAISGTSGTRTITFQWAFQPITNYPSFSPRKP